MPLPDRRNGCACWRGRKAWADFSDYAHSRLGGIFAHLRAPPVGQSGIFCIPLRLASSSMARQKQALSFDNVLAALYARCMRLLSYLRLVKRGRCQTFSQSQVGDAVACAAYAGRLACLRAAPCGVLTGCAPCSGAGAAAAAASLWAEDGAA